MSDSDHRPTRNQSVTVAYGSIQNENEEALSSEDDIYFGHKHYVYCWGGCCDFRTAVLVANGSSILVRLAVGIWGGWFLATTPLFTSTKPGGPGTVILYEMVVLVGIVFCGVGCYGALAFHSCALGTCIGYFGYEVVVHTILTLLLVDSSTHFHPWYQLFLLHPLLCLYFQICMMMLMNKGIMTKTNYHKVSDRCCC